MVPVISDVGQINGYKMQLSVILSSVGPHWAKVIKADIDDWLTDDGKILFYVLIANFKNNFILDINKNIIGHHEELFNGIESLMNDEKYYNLAIDFIEGLVCDNAVKSVDWLYLAGSTTCQYINEYFPDKI